MFTIRHKAQDELDSRYLNSLDLGRHQADSMASYQQCFSFLGKKMDEHQILPENTYNMDRKGFLLGRIAKAKRVFPKDLRASKKLLGPGQDGSRDWITVGATICTDATALPPLLNYDCTSGSIQDSWAKDFNRNEHRAWLTTSPSGWAFDNIGFKWLETLFDENAQGKARKGLETVV